MSQVQPRHLTPWSVSVMTAEDFEPESQSYKGGDSASLNTSRVIIKNLPKYATTEQVKKHLSVRGYNITDVKLAKTK